MVVRPYSTTRYGPPAVADQPYTFSIYMKADEAGRRVLLRVGDTSKRFELTTDWQRYYVTGHFPPPPARGRPPAVWVSFYCEDEGIYWADAAQCEVGEEPTEWVPDLFEGAVAR